MGASCTTTLLSTFEPMNIIKCICFFNIWFYQLNRDDIFSIKSKIYIVESDISDNQIVYCERSAGSRIKSLIIVIVMFVYHRNNNHNRWRDTLDNLHCIFFLSCSICDLELQQLDERGSLFFNSLFFFFFFKIKRTGFREKGNRLGKLVTLENMTLNKNQIEMELGILNNSTYYLFTKFFSVYNAIFFYSIVTSTYLRMLTSRISEQD